MTLHHLGIAWRRRAELRPETAGQDLERSANALTEAATIRKRHGLGEGRALSLFHLGVSLERLADGEPGAVLEEARRRYAEAAEVSKDWGWRRRRRSRGGGCGDRLRRDAI